MLSGLLYDRKMLASDNAHLLRRLPAVHEILKSPEVEDLCQGFSRELVHEVLTDLLDELRREIQSGVINEEALQDTIGQIGGMLEHRLRHRLEPSLKPVINATGVIVFTNAGRAPIERDIAQKAALIASRYSNLEFNLEKGTRGHRDHHLESRLTRILDCEAATVCNNAAAAVLLILNTLAHGKKVIVSRGELIEIGGSFRIPEIMRKSGAILAEVGTTNKTKVSDYRDAIGDNTALILRVHPSNYRIVGFTHRPKLEELAAVSRESGIPLVHDLGSGLLFPSDLPWLNAEPSATGSLNAGSDLVCFSGDKLLGGPQAGIIVGQKSFVDAIRKNPLMRVCRIDKMTSAALDLTLAEYEKGRFQTTLPVWRMLSTGDREIRDRAERLQNSLQEAGYRVNLQAGSSVTGGGSAPGKEIPTWLLRVRSPAHSTASLEAALRHSSPPVLARIEHDELIFDLRTVFPEEDSYLLKVLNETAGR